VSTYKPTDPLPENINRSSEHPLFTFASLLVQVVILLGVSFLILYLAGFLLAKNISMDNEYKYLNNYFVSDEKAKKGDYSDLANQLWEMSTTKNNVKFNPGTLSGTPNAFILPGGKIFLTSGFLKQTKSENELSFVLCHELGHFYHRHTINGLVTQFIVGLFHIVIGGSNSSAGLTGLAEIFVQSSYSRKQESEADEFALGCLNNKYQHINGYSHFFKKIKESDEGMHDKYFSSHPATEDRINNLKKIISDKGLSAEGELVPFKFSKEKKRSD